MTKTRGNQKTKTKTNAGGRSGVIIEEKVENDNVNEWFDTAHTPKAQLKNDASSSSQEEPSVDDGKNRAKTKTSRKKKTVKTPKRQVNMKLPGASEEEEQQQVDSEEEEGEMVSAKAKNYAKKLRRKGGNFTSPSDLSRVSTAPYSPRDDEDRKESAESESKSNQEDDSEIENALLTQAEGGGEEAGLTGENDDDDDVIARQAAAKGNTENLQPASPEDEFPVGGGDDYEEDDGGDDLGPPVLPDDYSEDEEKERGQQSETKKKNDIGGLDNSDDEKNDSVDVSANDYDNDDDEGPGFNMVHDPETPETVRENRAKKENEKLRNEKDKKKKKKKKSESDSDDDDDDDDDDEDSKSTPKVKKGRKQKKKKKRNVVFSPQGIPIANRDYESVPIGALVEGSPDDEDGARRSKRAKVKPLQYWRNEKMEYGAHNEDGYIGEAFGNMPVVTGIQKALPTPYKKRKQPKNNAGAKKNGKKQVSSNAKGNDQEEEFNSKKLRKMYKFHDGEEVRLRGENKYTMNPRHHRKISKILLFDDYLLTLAHFSLSLLTKIGSDIPSYLLQMYIYIYIYRHISGTMSPTTLPIKVR
jgi:hypothetical protein